jgi:serine protease Do
MSYYSPRLVGGAPTGDSLPRTGLAVFLVILLVALSVGLLVGYILLNSGKTNESATKEVSAATVWICVDGTNQGSGVIISRDGYILTAAHVVKDGKAGQVEVMLNDASDRGRLVRAALTQYIGKTGSTPDQMDADFALLKIEPPHGLPHLPVVASDGVRAGSNCIVAGYPLGSSDATPPSVHVDTGRITAVMQTAQTGVAAFNTDVMIREGMSGGPCTDDRGRLIGLCIMYSLQAAANLVLPTARFRDAWEPLANAS